jgi:hypothetical protein
MFDFAIAYIDPGSGSLIIQVAIATAVAIPIFLRAQIGRFVAMVRNRRAGAPPVNEPPKPD